MDHIAHIESLVSVLLVSIDAQMHSINFLGKHHQMHSALVYRTAEVVDALKRAIECFEQEHIGDIQAQADESLRYSASLSKTMRTANEQAPNSPILSELAEIVQRGHRSLTSSLAKSEDVKMQETFGRFAKLKGEVNSLLQRMSNL